MYQRLVILKAFEESIPNDIDFCSAVAGGELVELVMLKVQLLDVDEQGGHGDAADLTRKRERERERESKVKHNLLVPEGTYGYAK